MALYGEYPGIYMALGTVNYMKKYCCIELENAVMKGIVKRETIVDDKPEFDVYIVEIVTGKRTVRRRFRRDYQDIDTKEFILKNCLYCRNELLDRHTPTA